MFKFAKSFNMEIESLYGNDAEIYAGLMSAHIEASENGEEFEFSYEDSNGHEYVQEYELTLEGLEWAIWEWLCTLSRWTRPDNERTLGKKHLACVAEGA